MLSIITKIVKCFQLQKIKLRTESDKKSSPAVGFKDGNQLDVLMIKFKIQITIFRQSWFHSSLKLEQLNFA